MLQTIEVEIDAQGQVHPVGLNKPLPPGRALLTSPAKKAALLSESALAEDWLKPEEDKASLIPRWSKGKIAWRTQSVRVSGIMALHKLITNRETCRRVR
ncbi:hypothetical protein JKG41_08620 [Acidithiobacillus sp. MC2.1]|uniref:Uncharacterized protein n=1 Tax=Acidithiobacillus ferrooxidans (strain ATCC 23270 / DSM 14882 / CIP 104768 / NCIMB 8455) TaxID=243159 RepID=B7J9I3_ACIF2|nr:hypothetical protein [Acidithiobacillus sp. MC2.2]ACK78034.1 hypothetical protein AFE_1380 [Acidithiobacillus ferrooxidans ATCC 23270]MBN6745119.1 hypothetical protein [Acidithiobacillus sp. MC2.2]